MIASVLLCRNPPADSPLIRWLVQVLYNLFEWPTLPGARLAVVGISNTHDLDSRVLPRIASRLANCKLPFLPYNVEQLTTIANSRLQGSKVFHGELPVAMATRKVRKERHSARGPGEMRGRLGSTSLWLTSQSRSAGGRHVRRRPPGLGASPEGGGRR